MSQLELDGTPTLAPPEVRVSPRQRLALDYLRHHAPVPSDELGALLHEDRRARGLNGHSADERCRFCADEGKQMGGALRAKGLVRYRRGEGGGWYLADRTAPTPQVEEQEDPFPEGF